MLQLSLIEGTMKHHLLLTMLFLVGCSSTPLPVASRDAALSPPPNAQGKITQTGEATDLAIEGDGFFVLSRTKSPERPEDLVFTRDGYFHLEFSPGPVDGTGTYGLVNRDGLYVMAYQTTVDPAVRPFGLAPEESVDTLLTQAPGEPPVEVRPTALQLDLLSNPNVANATQLDTQGMLRISDAAPRDPSGRELNLHVVLAASSFPQYLQLLQRGEYAYTRTAGRLFLGTAANAGPGREVGTHNVLNPGAIERR